MIEKIGNFLWFINASLSWGRCIKIVGISLLLLITSLVAEMVADEFYTLSILLVVVLIVIDLFSDDVWIQELRHYMKKEGK